MAFEEKDTELELMRPFQDGGKKQEGEKLKQYLSALAGDYSDNHPFLKKKVIYISL